MKTAVATLAVTQLPLPDGKTFAGINIELSNVDGSIQVVTVDGTTTTSATFADLTAGSYTVTATAVDSTGAALAPAVSASFEVPADVLFPAPSSVTISLS